MHTWIHSAVLLGLVAAIVHDGLGVRVGAIGARVVAVPIEQVVVTLARIT